MASAIRALKTLKKEISKADKYPDSYGIWFYIGKQSEENPAPLTLGDLKKLLIWMEK